MELVAARGMDWTAAAWRDGEFTGFLSAHRWRADLRVAESALADARGEMRRLEQEALSQEEAIAYLHQRHETLCRVEQGGWWRLRGYLRSLLWLSTRLRARRGT